MKEFMLIYRGGDPAWKENTSEEELSARMARWGAWMEKLADKEQLIAGGSPLSYGGKRLTGDGLVTDISAAEFKELVSGYSIVAADSIDDALSLARDCPIFEYPNITVEVREVMAVD